jgi:transposase
MLAWELVVEAQALRSQGWSISAIARHLGVTRVTVRRYLNGECTPGQRARTRLDPFEEFAQYARLRLSGDPHVWGSTLYDELVELGYRGSYPSFTRAVRRRGLRPRCEACRQAKVVDRAVIEHPPGAETQWDWLELPNPPTGWGWGATAYVLLGVLPASGRWRGWLAESTDQPHLVEGLDQVVRRLGGVSRRWRFDRMSTVAQPRSGRLQVSFGPVAVHYAVGVDLCPAYHAWRKGAVEKSAHVIAQRWWRTLADDATLAAAQASLDRLCIRLDGRKRMRDGTRTTVGALAEGEPLRPVPAPFPVELQVQRTVKDQAMVAFRGNYYSVPPGHTGQVVQVRHRLGGTSLEVVSCHGVLLSRHIREPDGAGVLVRSAENVAALTRVVLANFADKPPCRRKDRRPPSQQALTEASRIRSDNRRVIGEQVVVDFAAYADQARPLGSPNGSEAS